MRLSLGILLLSVSLARAGWVTLAWDPVVVDLPDTSLVGYRIYWGTQSRVYSHVQDVGNVTQATVTGLVNTVTYYFAATAVDNFGLESDYSLEVSATIPPLPPPEYLQMAGNIFCWSYPVTSDTLLGFLVYRKEDGVKGTRQWAISDPRASSLAMTDLLPGSSYTFWVRAYTRFGSRRILSEPSERFSYTEPLRIYTGEFSILPPAMMDNGLVRVVFFNMPGRTHLVMGSPDLKTWEVLGTATEIFDGNYRFYTPEKSREFFKIAVVIP